MKLTTKTWFCPMCGADNQSSNAYCKRCGGWVPDIKSRSRTGFGGETPQQNIFTSLFMSALSTFAALFSAIALYATYLGSGSARWSVYVAAGFCLCIAGWQTASFIVGLKLRQRLKSARESPSSSEGLGGTRAAYALDAADTTELVRGPSVTESTTELLDPARRLTPKDEV